MSATADAIIVAARLPNIMKQNIWEFLRNEDGSYSVFHNGKRLSDSISEESRESEFCVRFGFCGEEYKEIVRQLEQSGKCTLLL